MNKKISSRGFTLIEVLIYIVLFGLLMSGAVVSAFQLLQSGENQELSFASEQEGTFIDRKLAWALAPATAVSVSNGGKTMTIARPDLGSQSPLTVDGGTTTITLARGNAAPQSLMTSGLPLSDVAFSTDPPANGLPEAVRASFTLGGKDFTYAMYLRQ